MAPITVEIKEISAWVWPCALPVHLGTLGIICHPSKITRRLGGRSRHWQTQVNIRHSLLCDDRCHSGFRGTCGETGPVT